MTIKDIKKSLVVFLAIFGFFSGAKVSATSYSYDVDVQFNFNSKLGVTITDADIKILDLAPGTSADSNIVGITISTNNVAGYTAEATVGNAQNATTNMTHTNGTNTFASIATDASQASLSTDNTWGYAISTDNGTSWSNFSGLPVYTEDGKQLASTDSPASDAIQFKINAKASTSQPAGDYTNVINFKVIANTPPRDWTDIYPSNYCATHSAECDSETGKVAIQSVNNSVCSAVEVYDSQFQVTDKRDHKTYWISKLQDNHCWMTQNLDLDLETTPTHVLALTSENTDLNTYGSNGYDTNNGYSKDANDVITWAPERATIPTSSISSAGLISSWTNDDYNPYSIDTGDWYWIGRWNNNGTDTWYASTTNNYLNTDGSGAGDKFSTSAYTGNGKHGHVGNYYNWSATIASNNSASCNASTLADITTNPQNSICPSGWRLPTVSNASDTDGSTNEFRRLVTLYGNTTGNDKALTANPLWFVRGGLVDGSSLYGSGDYGYYWSSTVYDSSYAYSLYFRSGGVYPASHDGRVRGRSVRCIAR